MADVQITSSDVSPTMRDDTVAFASPELVDNLIHDQAGALSFLADGLAPVAVDDISIDSLGRIVIKNKDFADKVRASLSQEGISVNWKCTAK
jgi:hypothetical protein